MKPKQPPTPSFQPGQHFQLMDEIVHDPLQDLGKLAEPAVCGTCKAVYHKGHWQWLASPPNAYLVQCPACKRVQQKLPAGYVTISGEFARSHEAELLALIHNLETREKQEHPLKRIMNIEHADGAIEITTTDIHLAHGIGEALHHAYKGELESHFNDAEYLLRVHWQR
ncbi:MAG: hypothetical protein H6R01_1823 [Burkholderiaceae bacterium]|nr:hypothetical protein [Burkholderiaceae bacterium]